MTEQKRHDATESSGYTCPKCGKTLRAKGGHEQFCGEGVRERIFWAKMDTTGDCWLWLGAKQPDGYGQVRIDGKTLNPHKYAYELVKGPVPKGAEIMHTCDVRHCCNPGHMRLGSHAENVREMWTKGRAWTKLNATSVREIREAFKGIEGRAAHALQRQLAEKYGVDPKSIWAVRTGRKWNHVQ